MRECVAEFELANANILEKRSSGFNVKRPFELGRRFFLFFFTHFSFITKIR